MGKTELSLDVANNFNRKVMRLFDTSHICINEKIENYLIEVLPVNKSKWVTFHVKEGFSLALNSSNLGYSRATDYSNLVNLPDGVYEIKQSYKPNIQTVQQYLHLRTVELDIKVQSERLKLMDGKCSISREDFLKNRDDLREIEEYIQAAKWKVEESHNKKEGIELYQWAEKLLEKYTNECKC